MLLHSFATTKGDLRVELMDGGTTDRCYRISDSHGDMQAVVTRAEAESLRDQLNKLLPVQHLLEAA